MVSDLSETERLPGDCCVQRPCAAARAGSAGSCAGGWPMPVRMLVSRAKDSPAIRSRRCVSTWQWPRRRP